MMHYYFKLIELLGSECNGGLFRCFNEGLFRCFNWFKSTNKTCIDYQYVCDGEENGCDDNSDEDKDMCKGIFLEIIYLK